MPDQVPEAVKRAQRKTAGTRSQDVGGVPPVLSRQTGDGTSGGRVFYMMESVTTPGTQKSMKVAVETEKDLSNTFVTGTLKTQLTEDIYLLVEF